MRDGARRRLLVTSASVAELHNIPLQHTQFIDCVQTMMATHQVNIFSTPFFCAVSFITLSSGAHPTSTPYLLTHLLTYLLTPWCRVLLDQLTGLQLVKKFPAFHGSTTFITALTSVRHLSLSWASPIQSIYPHPTSWRSILILSTHLHVHVLV